MKVEYTCVAQCAPEQVWKTVEDVGQWQRFDPEALRSVRWSQGEPWTAGSRLELVLTKPMPLTLTAELAEVKLGESFFLQAKQSGVTAELRFRFTAQGSGTEMQTVQEFSGAPLLFFGDGARSALEKSVAQIFGRVCAEAESRAR